MVMELATDLNKRDWHRGNVPRLTILSILAVSLSACVTTKKFEPATPKNAFIVREGISEQDSAQLQWGEGIRVISINENNVFAYEDRSCFFLPPGRHCVKIAWSVTELNYRTYIDELVLEFVADTGKTYRIEWQTEGKQLRAWIEETAEKRM
jgi:hypothetical protein